MTNKLHDKSKYRCIYDTNGIKLYMPNNPADYHISRKIELENQRIYAKMGCTKDVLEQTINTMLELVNGDNREFKTNIGILCNQLKYRMAYPLDHDLSIRMGALLCFIEGEDPDTCISYWLDKKLELCSIPDVYAFFLSMGIEQLKVLMDLPDISSIKDYLSNRQEMIQSLSLLNNK